MNVIKEWSYYDLRGGALDSYLSNLRTAGEIQTCSLSLRCCRCSSLSTCLHARRQLDATVCHLIHQVSLHLLQLFLLPLNLLLPPCLHRKLGLCALGLELLVDSFLDLSHLIVLGRDLLDCLFALCSLLRALLGTVLSLLFVLTELVGKCFDPFFCELSLGLGNDRLLDLLLLLDNRLRGRG